MKVSTIQNSFAAGEVSPLVGGRSDTQGYQSGVELMQNMFADSRGPAVSRDGFRHLHTFFDSKKAVMRTMQGSLERSLVLIFTEFTLTVFSDGGEIAQELFRNASFDDLSSEWDVTIAGSGSVSFLPGNVILDTGNQAAGRGEIAQTTTGLPTSKEYRLRIGLNTVSTFAYSVENADTQAVIVAETIVTTDTVDIEFNQTAPLGNIITRIWVLGSINIGTADIAEVSLTKVDDALIFFGTNHAEEDLDNIRIVPDGSNLAAYIFEKNVPAAKITYNPLTDTIAYGDVVWEMPPAEWVAGFYPRVGVIHEGKLYISNNTLQFWYSKSNEFEDFTPGLLADESASLTMRSVGVIEWMETGKSLLIGTTTQEHIVTSQGGVVFIGDFSIQKQSNYGSAFVQPVLVGDLLLYVSPDRRKIRSIQYVWQEDVFKSTDLTFFSEHITLGKIKEMAWQQDPDNILWAVMLDGTFAALTYERSNNVWGWHSHKTQGVVGNMATYASTESSRLLSLVDRGINEEFVYSIEVGVKDIIMDSFGVEGNLLPAFEVFGFFHFILQEGDTGAPVFVHAFGDGIYYGLLEVVKTDTTEASITFPVEVQIAVAGYGFDQIVTTLPINKGSANGAGEAWLKGFSKLLIKIHNSNIPKINGTRPPARLPEVPMTESNSRVTKLLEVTQSGYEYENRVTILQDLPYRLTIIYIAGELAQNQL